MIDAIRESFDKRQETKQYKAFIKELDNLQLPLSPVPIEQQHHIPRKHREYLNSLSAAFAVVSIVKDRAQDLYMGMLAPTEGVEIHGFERQMDAVVRYGQSVGLVDMLETYSPKRTLSHVVSVVGDAFGLNEEDIERFKNRAKKSYDDNYGRAYIEMDDKWTLHFSVSGWKDERFLDVALNAREKEEYIAEWIQARKDYLGPILDPSTVIAKIQKQASENYTDNTTGITSVRPRDFGVESGKFSLVMADLGWQEITDDEDKSFRRKKRFKYTGELEEGVDAPILQISENEYPNGESEVYIYAERSNEMERQIRQEFSKKYREVVRETIKKKIDDKDNETINLSVVSLVTETLSDMGQDIPEYNLAREMRHLAESTFDILIDTMSQDSQLAVIADSYRKLADQAKIIENQPYKNNLKVRSGFRPEHVTIKIDKAYLH